MDLSAFDHASLHLLQAGSTLLTIGRTVRDDSVGGSYHRQRHPWVATLSATFLARWLSLTVRFAPEPIAGRRFTTVMAIFGQPPLQFTDPGERFLQLLLILCLQVLQSILLLVLILWTSYLILA